jgi:uncharacterized protein (TIGR00369 family)
VSAVASREQAQSRSLMELVEGVTSRGGYTSAIGTRVLRAEAGCVWMSVARRPDLVQFNGFFHGGVIAGLADHAAGGAVTTMLPPDRIAVTIGFDVSFLAPADGDEIVAKAQVVRVGGTIGVATVDVTTPHHDGARACALCVETLRSVRRQA